MKYCKFKKKKNIHGGYWGTVLFFGETLFSKKLINVGKTFISCPGINNCLDRYTGQESQDLYVYIGSGSAMEGIYNDISYLKVPSNKHQHVRTSYSIIESGLLSDTRNENRRVESVL